MGENKNIRSLHHHKAPKVYHKSATAADDDNDDDYSSDGSSELGYSDDSASLSDAYFFPQPEEDRLAGSTYMGSIDSIQLPTPPPPASHKNGTNYPYHHHHHLFGNGSAQQAFYTSNNNSSSSNNVYPMAPYYGSIHSTEQRASSPLWVDGSIQEDSELVSFQALNEDGVTSTPLTKKERKRQRKQQRYMQRCLMKQREQMARERAVLQVRGQPQEMSTWHDPVFAIIFLIQLAVVLACALKFGSHVISFTNSGKWDGFTGKFHWEHREVTRRLIESGSVISTTTAHSSLALQSNHTNSTTMHAIDTDDFVPLGTLTPIISKLQYEKFTIDYKNVIALVSITGFYSCILTYMSFGFMLILSRALIHVMLVFSIAVSIAWGVVGLTLDPYGIISILGFSALLLTLGHTIHSWSRIPFAASNLHTALTAMRCTADITVLGLTSLVVAFAWCVIWTMAFIGVVNSINTTDCNKTADCNPHVTYQYIPVYIFFLLSFHWTNTVIKNVVRVTVAGAIGTWWYHPEQVDAYCTSAVSKPLWRCLTKSFGSICLGSLVGQVAQVLHLLQRWCCRLAGVSDSSCFSSQKRRIMPTDKETQPLNGKKDGTNGTMHTHSIPQSLDTPLEVSNGDEHPRGFCNPPFGIWKAFNQKLKCCNRWAYTYIGMYGYGFFEAGEKAIQLFETREWMEVVRDNLIQNVLIMASVVIGGSAGVFAVVVEETDGYDFTTIHKPIISAFIVGFVLGFVLSNILLLGIVGSAVNTILVCFAAGPFEYFSQKHPRLSREMYEVWSQQVWEPAVEAPV